MNRTSIASVIGILLLAAGCGLFDQRPKADPARAAAAAKFTKRYSKSRFAEWHVVAQPAGGDCKTLLIETQVLLDDIRVEAVQFGLNSWEIYEGGALALARDAKFATIVYRDGGDNTWAFASDGTRLKDRTVTPCR